MATLLLIRHGETDWNLAGKYSGQADIPLNETGRAQAAMLIEELAQHPIDAIFASDLERAVETAEIVARGCFDEAGSHVEVQTDSRLREINQGVWEGMHFDEIKSRFGPELAAREANPLEVSAPGGETVADVQRRVLAAVRDICQKHASGRVVIVGHGLALAIIRVWLLKTPIEAVWSLIPPNAEIIKLELSQTLLTQQIAVSFS